MVTRILLPWKDSRTDAVVEVGEGQRERIATSPSALLIESLIAGMERFDNPALPAQYLFTVLAGTSPSSSPSIRTSFNTSKVVDPTSGTHGRRDGQEAAAFQRSRRCPHGGTRG